MRKPYAVLMMALLLTAGLASGCQKRKTGAEPETKTEESRTPGESQRVEESVAVQDTKEAEVVIVGAGAAGLSAALEAAGRGAESVIILEMTDHTGGSLALSSGRISASGAILQTEDGIEDDMDTYAEDLWDAGEGFGGRTDRRQIEAYVRGAEETFSWMWDHGLSDYRFRRDPQGRKTLPDPDYLLYSSPRTYEPIPKEQGKYQSAVHELLDQMAADESRISIEFQTRAVELVPNEKGQILGVTGVHLDKGGATRYHAKKGVIIATGGYSSNPKLLERYGVNGKDVLTGGPESADGNGLLLMQRVGGALNEASMSWIPTLNMGVEEKDQPGAGRIAYTNVWRAGGICVNQNGQRFMNELSYDPADREIALLEQPGAVQYEIFTDKILEDLSRARLAAGYNESFRNDNSPFHSLVKEGGSLDELAVQIHVPPENLINTVEDYNRLVEEGGRDTFGRTYPEEENPFEAAVNKIEGKRFYAIPIHAICVRTLGGISVNDRMQVVDSSGHPIPGLYAAGEAAGGIWGRFASSGTGTMGAAVFGRKAAEGVMTVPLEEGYEVKPAKNLLEDALFVQIPMPPLDR